MDKPIIHDLDVLRPKPEFVKLGGKEIDISFIPSGVALEIMSLRSTLESLTDTAEKVAEIEAGGDAALKSFEITAEICAKITETQHKEMTKEWLLKNTDVLQLKALIEYITQAMLSSLEAGGVDIKNPQAVKPN
jgi:hypothetical protein